MKALVLQNSTSSGLGSFRDILENKYKMVIDTIDPRRTAVEEFYGDHYDLVIILGSSRGVYEQHLEWIRAQTAFTRKLLDENRPLIGICFGGQIIASALNAQVRPMEGGKIKGWIENDFAVDDIWRGPWFRWHGDIFDFPDGAIELAADGDVPQAFQINSAVGTQFHPEVTEEIIASWVAELTPEQYPPNFDAAVFLQSANEKLLHARARTEALLDDMLERVLSGDQGRSSS